MSTNKPPHKKDRPEIVKLNSALELAKKWVNNMTEPAEDEPIVIQSRPARLGLGATVARPSQFVPSDDPLERKLHYKLSAAKRNAAKAAEDSALAAKDDDNDDEDEDLDSRTSAFGKKRAAVPVSPPLQAKKKQK